MQKTIHLSKHILVRVNHVRLKSGRGGGKINNLNDILLKMPRERNHIAEAQRQRIKIKEKGAKYPPGTVTLQVLGCGAPGAPASVYLFTDQSRYLFNCGEGTQRLAHEHKTKLARLEHIFLTRTSWNRLGGLPGLSLTVQDAGVPNLTLHGPSGLDEIYQAMRKFVVLTDLKVEAENCEKGGCYDDEVMTVNYIPIEKKIAESNESSAVWNPNDLELDCTDYYGYESGNIGKNLALPSVITNYTKKEECIVMCYICKLKPKPGSLNLEKCIDRLVPPGPLLGKLKNGIDIILPDGTIIKADEVRGPTDPGPVFIFIDIPDEEYLSTFKEKSILFAPHQSTATNEANVASVVVHFSPKTIVENAVYKEFIDSFPPSTKHLMLNRNNKFSGYLAAHRIQWQLNQLNENIFPILKEYSNIQCSNVERPFKRIKLLNSTNDCPSSTSNVYSIAEHNEIETKNDISYGYIDYTNSLTSYHLRPKKGLDRSNEPVINPSEYLEESNIIEGFKESLHSLKENLLKSDTAREKEFPKILFLGTGSCIPNKTRNVSSILVQTNPDSCMLLDCGEGSWGQLVRFYGQEDCVDVLRNLKIIYVSHLHADHHIGLIGLLKKRWELFGNRVKPITLLAPKQINSWLFFYNQRIESICDSFNLVPNANFEKEPFKNSELLDMSIDSISTCSVRHCPHSYAISVNVTNSNSEVVKITYSGDTTPCSNIIELGKNSDVLIHEATMEDELISEARSKRHSTVSQAIEQGRKMNAKFTLLTHFSQRYAKLPRINDTLARNVGIAFDNMQVTLDDLENLHLLHPTLKILFSEHCEEMEQKALKRAMKKEREKS